eukprot:scaffold12169_cov132-Cylindrotheca_fusiformis.AAC.3
MTEHHAIPENVRHAGTTPEQFHQKQQEERNLRKMRNPCPEGSLASRNQDSSGPFLAHALLAFSHAFSRMREWKKISSFLSMRRSASFSHLCHLSYGHSSTQTLDGIAAYGTMFEASSEHGSPIQRRQSFCSRPRAVGVPENKQVRKERTKQHLLDASGFAKR